MYIHVFYHYSKLTQHNDHRSVVMEHLSSALPAFVGLLVDHMTNPVMYHSNVYHVYWSNLSNMHILCISKIVVKNFPTYYKVYVLYFVTGHCCTYLFHPRQHDITG